MEEVKQSKKRGRPSRLRGGLAQYNKEHGKRKFRARAYAYRHLVMGVDRQTIIDTLVNIYEYSGSGAEAIYLEAENLYANKTIKSSEEIIDSLQERINVVSQQAFESGDYSSALRGLDMMAKTVGMYAPDKLEVANKEGEVFKVVID